MVKKTFCLALALLMGMLCIAGCGADTDPASSAPSVSATSQAEETVPAVTWIPSDQEEPLVAYDPDREIYFTCHNYYYTIYAGMSPDPKISFDILSLKPLDLNTMEIPIPVETPYWIAWNEWEYEWTYDYGQYDRLPGGRDGCLGYPYYLYALEQGMDYAELWTYYEAFINASPEEMLDRQAIYEECVNRYWEGYQALTEEDRPEFYAYHVDIYFVDPEATLESLQNMAEEVITSLDIIIEGVTYHEEIGEVRLAGLPELGDAELDYDAISCNSGAWMPYCGGTWEQHLHAITAKEDMTITGIQCLNSRLEMTDLIIRYNGSGLNYNMEWNGTDPITVNEGDTIEFFATFTDPEIKNVLDYATKVWVFIFYESASGSFYRLTEGTVGTGYYTMNGMELYDILFRGMDTSAYWEDYTAPKEAMAAYWKD